MSGKVPMSKEIATTSSSIEHFPEQQKTRDKTILQQQDTSAESLSSSPPAASSSTHIKKSTFSGPGGTKLINSLEAPVSSVYAQPSSSPPPTTTTGAIFQDQIVNDGVRGLSTQCLDDDEENKNNNTKGTHYISFSPAFVDNRFPTINESDEPTTDDELSKLSVYREQYVYHVPPRSSVQTNNLRDPGNTRKVPVSQKRKLDDNSSNEQDTDQQQTKRQERPLKRTNVTEEIDKQNNNEDDRLEAQDWKSVLHECIEEYRKNLEAEEKNLIMLTNILRRLQKLYALAVKSINKIDEDMQNSRQVYPSDALDKYNQFLSDAMNVVNKDS